MDDNPCVGREEIKYIGKVFLNSLEEIAQRSEFRGSENVIHSRPGQRRADRPVDWRAQRAQT